MLATPSGKCWRCIHCLFWTGFTNMMVNAGDLDKILALHIRIPDPDLATFIG
jgi:hypothetical protein